MAELRTFIFTDIAGSVDLKGELPGRSVAERDEVFVQQILVPHRARIEESLVHCGGRIVSTAGDGHFLVFENAVLAAQWAIQVQRRHQEDAISTPRNRRVAVRMSMHVGEPQSDPREPDNFIGKSVDYAARLNDFAVGDQIMVSRTVMAILDDAGLDGVRFFHHGRHDLKGIGEVEIHELLYNEGGPHEIRRKPKINAEREWTVIPSVGISGTDRQSNASTDTAEYISVGAHQRIGNYQLLKKIGGGGMGDVYKARHTQFNKLRAIKVIKPELVASGNPEVIRRFYHEIKTIGALEHRNIVVAIDSSASTDPIHYLVMELVDGVALSDLVDRHGPLPFSAAAELTRQAARGLQFVHKNGMVHRDIKPSNLMLTLVEDEASSSDASGTFNIDRVRGVVKILDLGLALLTDSNQERLTRFDNRALGTGMYMSPEQWKSTSVDVRSDIYSLGCTLYHLLAGDPPFANSDLKPEKAHEREPLPQIRNVPPGLWEVLKRMLAKRPVDRFATPEDVAEALGPFAEGHDVVSLVRGKFPRETASTVETQAGADLPSRPESRWFQASSVYPGRRQRMWLAGIVMVSCLIGGVWLFELVRQRNQAEVVQRMAQDRLAIAEKAAYENLPLVATVAASKTLGPEIDLRFDILSRAAEDQELRQQLEKLNGSPGDRELLEKLKQWLVFRSDANNGRANADSWLLNDARGVLVTRTPASDSVGRNFAYRDYFHGQGRDLKPEAGLQARPLTSPHISAVFKSKDTDHYKVAFSVPVWNWSGPPHSTVLGVLSMSLDLGEFIILEKSLQKSLGDNQVVLVDLREDFLEGDIAQRGRVLHHPLLGTWRGGAEGGAPPRIDPKVLAAIDADTSAAPNFVTSYRDPLELDSEKKFWGGFERVVPQFATLPESTSKSLDWAVIVQRPLPE